MAQGRQSPHATRIKVTGLLTHFSANAQLLKMILHKKPLWMFVAGLLSVALAGLVEAAERPTNVAIKADDGVIVPRRPMVEAITDAMQFLNKADGGYVPGGIDGNLAGYFVSAFVHEDGTRSDRTLAYPARQHAYFIRTFLRYYAYTGEREWLLRARDLADWNLAHSTPAADVYADLPYSTFRNGQPGGNQDKDSIEPDKAAFLGTGYLAVYEATAEKKYLDAARKIADTLVRRQREDGSWPFRVVPEDGKVFQDFGGAPVFFVEFLEAMVRHEDKATYHRAHQGALTYMLGTNVEKNLWGTYHEDVGVKEAGYLSAEPMSFTADYLFRHGKAHPEYVEMGRYVIRRMEEKLVHTEGHAAAPAPAVAEQVTFDHIMPGHTARYCLALADLYSLTRDEQVKRRAMSGMNAVTYMQAPSGLFRTFFYDVKRKSDSAGGRPDWYSQHLYTVCHLLEATSCFPELVPEGQDHLLGSSTGVREIAYGPGRVRFRASAPSQTLLKLSFVPQAVYVETCRLRKVPEIPANDGSLGWSFDPETHLLRIRHNAGQVDVLKSDR
jgi:hypothetical protein